MDDDIPKQSAFLYTSTWTPTIDVLLLTTMLKLKAEHEWEGTVFPSHFILEAESIIKNELGLDFDWAALYDRLGFLEKRYNTFTEMLRFDGTRWDAATNLVKAGDRVWTDLLPRKPLVAAYYTHGDPVYHLLADLFAPKEGKVSDEPTLVLSEHSESVNNEFVVRKKAHNAQINVMDDDSDSEPGCHIRRKLLFDDGSPSDKLSSNNKGRTYCVMGEDGKMSKKIVMEHGYGLKSLPKNSRTPHKLPPGNSDSNSPIMYWRMPQKPPF